MKTSSIVNGSHFADKSQCKRKLSQLSKMLRLIGVINNPGLIKTPRKSAQFNLFCFLVLTANIAWFFLPSEHGNSVVVVLLICLFVFGLLVREVILAPDNYLDSLFDKLEEYEPLNTSSYLNHGVKEQIEKRQLNISATRRWIYEEMKSITDYMDKNNFSHNFYDNED